MSVAVTGLGVGARGGVMPLLVFGAWALTVTSGFWFALARPALATAQSVDALAVAALAEAWWQQQPARAHARGFTLVYLPAGRCACAPSDAAAFAALAQRWRTRNVQFLTAGAGVSVPGPMPLQVAVSMPRLPSGIDVLLFDAVGQMRYAGSLQPGLGCGEPSSLVDALLQQAAAGALPAQPLSLRASCDCTALSI